MIDLRLQHNGGVQIYDLSGNGELIAIVFSGPSDAYHIGKMIAEYRGAELRVATSALYHQLRELGVVE